MGEDVGEWDILGDNDFTMEGACDGEDDGFDVGCIELVGLLVGEIVGFVDKLGYIDGVLVGDEVGAILGITLGNIVGRSVGLLVGDMVG